MPGRRQTIVTPKPTRIRYVASGETCRQFLLSDAFVAGIMGPIGSGKSTACVMKLIRNCDKQKPGPDGVSRRRTAIIRNTYNQLKTTTIQTWQQWMPTSIGNWTDTSPPSHHIQHFTPQGRLIRDWLIWFLALDRPEDIRKLLSMELSDAWINEAREIPKAILDGLTGRVGRYPQTVRDTEGKVLYGPTDPQIIMDTNPPDSDHWWAKLADFGSIEFAERTKQLEDELHTLGSLREDQRLYGFYKQPGGRDPGAENLQNLDPGYYLKAMAGKSDDWIKVYVDACYGFVQEGKPVYPEYRDTVHAAKEFALNPELPVHVGIDFGLTPAAVFGQRTVMGGWRIHSELVSEDMGARRFGELLKVVIQERYRGMAIGAITGDPAGEARAQTDEVTAFQILRAVGVEARPAPTNDWTRRREEVALYLNKMVDGEPALSIHPQCVRLRKALGGGYHYRRLQVVGDERFTDVPEKNMHSHVADALPYMMLGAGDSREVIRRDPKSRRQPQPRFADTDFATDW